MKAMTIVAGLAMLFALALTARSVHAGTADGFGVATPAMHAGPAMHALHAYSSDEPHEVTEAKNAALLAQDLESIHEFLAVASSENQPPAFINGYKNDFVHIHRELKAHLNNIERWSDQLAQDTDTQPSDASQR